MNAHSYWKLAQDIREGGQGERREGVGEWYPPVDPHILYNSQCVLANKTWMLNEMIELKIPPVHIFLCKNLSLLTKQKQNSCKTNQHLLKINRQIKNFKMVANNFLSVQ